MPDVCLLPRHRSGVVGMGAFRRPKPPGVDPPSFGSGLGWNGDVQHLVKEDEGHEPRRHLRVVQHRVDANHGRGLGRARTESQGVPRSICRPASPLHLSFDGAREMSLLGCKERVEIVVMSTRTLGTRCVLSTGEKCAEGIHRAMRSCATRATWAPVKPSFSAMTLAGAE